MRSSLKSVGWKRGLSLRLLRLALDSVSLTLMSRASLLFSSQFAHIAIRFSITKPTALDRAIRWWSNRATSSGLLDIGIGAKACRAKSVQLRAAVALAIIVDISLVSLGLKDVAILLRLSISSLRYSARVSDKSAGAAHPSSGR